MILYLAMKMLKEKSNLTYEDIEEETTIQISSIKNIFSGKRDGTLLRLTVILMAMGAEPDVAYHVIDKSGVRIDMANEETFIMSIYKLIRCMQILWKIYFIILKLSWFYNLIIILAFFNLLW